MGSRHGETIWSKGSTIYLDGHALKQRWPHELPLGRPIASRSHAVTVPSHDYFVVSDNEPASCDSRAWGFVSFRNIVGKVIAIG